MTFILITYLAGVLTILSPCILPVLPFVFSQSDKSFLKNSLPLLFGMSLTFSLFSALAIVSGEWIGQANEIGRIVAMVLLSIFALTLIFPPLSDKLLAPLTRMGSKIGNNPQNNGAWGSFLIGVSTGLLWAPCAGPILGLVLTGAASQKSLSTSVALLASYSLGAASSLALALVAGNRFLGIMKKFLGVDQVIKKVLGVTVLLGVVAIALNLDRTVLTQISKVETASVENKLLSIAGLEKKEEAAPSMMMMSSTNNSKPRYEGELPEIDGAITWLNSKPLTKEDLLGKVVLVDFWTYSCINCLRTLPYLKTWAEKYKNDDFVVIGVHTPEFAFEKSKSNVQKAVTDLGITYPVAVDSDYKIWNAFGNQYWPAHYFIDRQGRIRHHHFGEGEYEKSEEIIRSLLLENGGTIQAQNTKVKAMGIEAGSAGNTQQSPETYIGFKRAENFVSLPAAMHDKKATYTVATALKRNQWGITGTWLVSAERAVSESSKSKVTYRFHARDLHLVLGSAKKVRFKVTVDGHAPEADRGIDVSPEGSGVVQENRLYQLIRLKDTMSIEDHTFEIEFSEPGVEVYAFTFG